MKIAGDKLGSVLLAATIGSVVALLVSPFAQTVSFILNEYLSRPIMSIEYVEVVQEDQPLPFPAEGLQALLRSPGYRSAFMRDIRPEPALMAAQGRTAGAPPAELQTLRSATERYVGAIEKRVAELDAFRATLAGSDEQRIRDVATKYRGFASADDAASLKASLLPEIEAEKTSLRDTVEMGRGVLKSLTPTTQPAQKPKFKLSVLNRGSTDGLIRHAAELRVSGENLAVKLRRTPPPEKKRAEVGLSAIPVAVTNPPVESTDRVTSVGKVEKHSMSEFWMEIDEVATPAEAITIFAGLHGANKLADVMLILFDHQNKSVEHRFTMPAKSKQ